MLPAAGANRTRHERGSLIASLQQSIIMGLERVASKLITERSLLAHRIELHLASRRGRSNMTQNDSFILRFSVAANLRAIITTLISVEGGCHGRKALCATDLAISRVNERLCSARSMAEPILSL
jgi:hypothetical protein